MVCSLGRPHKICWCCPSAVCHLSRRWTSLLLRRCVRQWWDGFWFGSKHQSRLKVHLNLLASSFISVLSFPFGCLHLFEVTSVHLFSLTCTSCCILITASVLLCGPSAAALTLSQFCPMIRKRKSNFPNFPRFVSLWAIFALCCFPSSFCLDELFALLPPFPLSVLNLIRVFLFVPFFPLLFLPLFLNSPPFHLMASTFKSVWVLTLAVSIYLGVWGPFPDCFLQRSSGPSPGCFFFFLSCQSPSS